jgi:hypothetical protein
MFSSGIILMFKIGFNAELSLCSRYFPNLLYYLKMYNNDLYEMIMSVF